MLFDCRRGEGGDVQLVMIAADGRGIDPATVCVHEYCTTSIIPYYGIIHCTLYYTTPNHTIMLREGGVKKRDGRGYGRFVLPLLDGVFLFFFFSSFP